ncbi:NAD(P)/FAD-dependent oxidoreductase [Sinomonas soli]
MTSASASPRIVVLGGGVLGVSTAVHLLRGGAAVVLATEAGLFSEATGRSLSWLNSAGERSAAYHRLRDVGMDRYRTLYAADPGREWLQFSGGLHWKAAGGLAATEKRHAAEQDRGYHSLLFSPAQVAQHVPGVDPEAIPEAAIFNPGEGWVSLPHLVEFLMEDFHRLGGELVLHAGEAGVWFENGRTVGVVTETGRRIGADAVVVACGAATPRVLARLGVDVPTRSPLAMLVETKPVEHGLKSVLNTPRVAVRPNPGGTLVLDHDWYEDQLVDYGDGTFGVDEEVVQTLAAEASRVLAGHPEVKPASWRIGYKPIPGDGEPVFGQASRLPGCFVAFSHSGATLGLVAGELLASEILSGRPHPLLYPFSPDRFA